MNKIDFILTWVDGSDPAWQKLKSEYDPDYTIGSAHYRDWGLLRFWFRSIEKYAPWVNKIHFVTCGQVPEWLNAEHPKLHLVDHKDYIPEECLPTFSANPIELNFHRINDLSEQFVYFNDDTFLSAPVVAEDFFKNGLPLDSFKLSALVPSVKNEVITYILFNDLLLINANFNKNACVKKNVFKYLNFKYGKDNLKTLYYLLIGKFSGFENPHLPNAFLKSTFKEVWAAEGDYLEKVSKNKFRTKEDVNQYLMRYWRLVKGEFVPRSSNIGRCYTLGIDNEPIENSLKNQRYKMICLNDNSQLDDIEAEQQWICNLFEQLFPEKSSFER